MKNNTILSQLSTVLSKVQWQNEEAAKSNLKLKIEKKWPMSGRLSDMMKKKDSKKGKVGDHVLAVVASINQLLSGASGLKQFFIQTGNESYDTRTNEQVLHARNICWGTFQKPSLFGNEKAFAEAFLRVSALYHDIGKLIQDDHHVSRGVHLMRDVCDEDRRAVESIFNTVINRRCFWNVLRHHDIFWLSLYR